MNIMTESSKRPRGAFRNFQKFYRLKKILNPELSINAIAKKAHKEHSEYSASFYQKVLRGERDGTREVWSILYEALNLSSLEAFMANPSWLIRQIGIDWKKYGNDQPVLAYYTEYAGMNVFYHYELIGKENSFTSNAVKVERYSTLQCRLIDMYTFLVNQNRGSYLYSEGYVPPELKDYIQYVLEKQDGVWRIEDPPKTKGTNNS